MRPRAFQPKLEPLDERLLPSLTPAGNYAVNTIPLSVVTADFNNDGQLDLAAVNGAINVLSGTNDGTFGTPINSPGNVWNPVVGDFDGDGNDDLAAMYSTYYIDNSDGPYPPWGYWWGMNVDVSRGNGDGTFQLPRTVYAFETDVAVELRVAESNGDRRSDLGIDFGEQYPYYFTTLFGNADGSFSATGGNSASFPQPPAPDLNADGIGDAITLTSAGVVVRISRANGVFMPEQVFATGGHPTGVITGDFNGDGRLDVATSNYNSTVSVFLNDGFWLPTNIPEIRVDDILANEGNAGTRTFTFTVTLSAASSQTVMVGFQTADSTATAGSDYIATSGTLTFAPGETIKTIAVFVKGDRVAEEHEKFFVNLSSPSNAIVADTQGIATIGDDEPRVGITDVTKTEGKKGKTTLFTFTVTLSVAYDQPIAMSFSTVNGTATTSNNDYVAKSGTLIFVPGETSKTITIEVKGDDKYESNETFFVDLYGLSSNAIFFRNRGIGTILNDD